MIPDTADSPPPLYNNDMQNPLHIIITSQEKKNISDNDALQQYSQHPTINSETESVKRSSLNYEEKTQAILVERYTRGQLREMLRNTLRFVLLLFVLPAFITGVFFFLPEDGVVMAISILTALHVNITLYHVGRYMLLMTLLSGVCLGLSQILLKQLEISFYRVMIFPLSVCVFATLSPVYHYLFCHGYIVQEGVYSPHKTTFISTLWLLGSVVIIFAQIYCTVLLATKLDTAWDILVFCGAYPFFILSFKVTARNIANQCSASLGERLVFQSVIFAAFPFRVLFINLAGSWLILLGVMIILLVFKTMKYCLKFHPRARQAMLTVKSTSIVYLASLKLIASLNDDGEETVTEEKKKKKQVDMDAKRDEQTQQSFYFHVLFDLGSTPLTAVLFICTRHLNNSFVINVVAAMSTQRFTQLLWQLLVSFVIDLGFLVIVLVSIPSLRVVLMKGYASVQTNLWRYCVHAVFLVVLVVYLLSSEKDD